MAVVTWDGSSSTVWTLDANWDTGSAPTSSDDVIIPNVSNDPVIPDGTNPEVKTIELAASATLTCGNNTITVNNETSQYAFKGIGTLIPQTSTIEVTTDADTLIKCENGSFNNLTINPDGGDDTITLYSAVTVGGNLTITGGTLDTNSSSNHALTVTGDVSVTGTLTGNASAISMGSLTIESGGTYLATSGTTTLTNKASSNFAFKNSGTFTHNSGTMQIGDGSTSTGGAHLMNNTYYNLIINRDENAPDGNTPWRPSSGTEVTIAGNLTVTKGRFYRNSSSNSLVVTGDVDIAANGQVGTSAASGSNTFGGIRINSGGTYLATSGTTTVTNRFTGTSNVWKNDGGTFTHNNGTVKFTDNDHSLVKEAGSFYNFEQASSLGDYALLWETGGGGSCTILNNLTITRGDFEIHAAGDTLDIHGQTILNGSSDSGARFNNDKNQTGTITHHGIVTINGGTYHVEDGATVNMAGIRNLGGVVD
jgi:hypothetical protein